MKRNIYISLWATSFLFSAHSAAQIPDSFEETPVAKLNTASLRPGNADLPSSTTVITGAELGVLGITKIYDALRLVPGMAVGKHSTSRIAIGYHGTNAFFPRRMKVLIDGMAINITSYSAVYWNAIPIAVEDIERIEVTRNPDMPLNGANSFQSTINFITKHPGDVNQHQLVASTDSNGLDKHSALINGNLGKTDISVRVENIENPGFDAAWRSTPTGIEKIPAFDGQHDRKINIFTNTDISQHSELLVQGGLMEGEIEKEPSDVNAIGLNDESFDSSFFNSRITYDDLDNDVWTIQASSKTFKYEKNWDTCYPTFLFTDELRAMHLANPAYAAALIAGEMPSGGSPADDVLAMAALLKVQSMGAAAFAEQCGNVNDNFEDSNDVVSVENRHIFGDSLLWISGVEHERRYFASESQVGGAHTVMSMSLYSSIQYNPSDFWTFNVGGLYNKDDLNDEWNTSPIAGAGFHFSPNHTLKLIYSRSFRSPSILERNVAWSYYMKDFTNPFDGKTSGYFYRLTTNPYADRLEEEKLVSYELSLNGSFFSNAVEYDLRAFDEHLKDLISQDVSFSMDELNNDSETELSGIEGELHYKMNHNWKYSLGFSYMENESTNVNETLLFHPYSGFTKLTYISQTFSGSLAYYSANNEFTSFDSMEATFGSKHAFGDNELFWLAKLSTQSSDYVSTLGGFDGAADSRADAIAWFGYKNDYNLSLKIGVSF